MYVFSWISLLLCTIPGFRGALRAIKEPPETRRASTILGLGLVTAIMLALGLLLLQTNNLY